MPLFSADSSVTPAPPLGLAWRDPAMIALVICGTLLRIVAAVGSEGFIHPDEHQQYLEWAQGILGRPYVPTWENTEGGRHALYPALLAGFCLALEWMGVTDPETQATVIRAALSLLVLSSCVLAFSSWLGEHPTAARVATAIVALAPEFLFFNVRTLSETAVIIPLMAALFLLRAGRPAVAGVLCAGAFAVRFHAGFLVAGLVAQLLIETTRSASAQERRRFARFLAGLATTLLLLGFWDRLQWGGWFQTPIAYFRRNVLEGFAATFGVLPWHGYVGMTVPRIAEFGPMAFLFLGLGIAVRPAIALPSAVFLLAHSCVGHKEPRFLLPIYPMAALLAGLGCEFVLDRIRAAKPRRLVAGAALVGLAAGLFLQYRRIDWRLEPTRSNVRALAWCGRQSDLRAVGVFGTPSWMCGNYCYLRRDVPLLTQDVPKSMEFVVALRAREANYLICRPVDIVGFATLSPEPAATFAELTVYRLKAPFHRVPSDSGDSGS